VVAFDEHDERSIRTALGECKMNIAILETTLLEQNTRTGTVDFTQKPLPIGEDLSEGLITSRFQGRRSAHATCAHAPWRSSCKMGKGLQTPLLLGTRGHAGVCARNYKPDMHR
jgi:hypothetical protein